MPKKVVDSLVDIVDFRNVINAMINTMVETINDTNQYTYKTDLHNITNLVDGLSLQIESFIKFSSGYISTIEQVKDEKYVRSYAMGILNNNKHSLINSQKPEPEPETPAPAPVPETAEAPAPATEEKIIEIDDNRTSFEAMKAAHESEYNRQVLKLQKQLKPKKPVVVP